MLDAIYIRRWIVVGGAIDQGWHVYLGFCAEVLDQVRITVSYERRRSNDKNNREKRETTALI